MNRKSKQNYYHYNVHVDSPSVGCSLVGSVDSVVLVESPAVDLGSKFAIFGGAICLRFFGFGGGHRRKRAMVSRSVAPLTSKSGPR